MVSLNLYEYAPKGLTWIDSFGLRYIKTKLPPKVIVEADEVTIEYYYSNNHLQIHAHWIIKNNPITVPALCRMV